VERQVQRIKGELVISQPKTKAFSRSVILPKPTSKPAGAKQVPSTFQAVKGKYRKPGTGCITQINDHLWKGRCASKVNRKRIARNIYAATEEECEEQLAELIAAMKKELAPLRAGRKAG